MIMYVRCGVRGGVRGHSGMFSNKMLGISKSFVHAMEQAFCRVEPFSGG